MFEGRSPIRPRGWPALVLVLLLLAAGLLLGGQPLYRFVADQAHVRAWVESLGLWGPAGIVALQVMQVLAMPIPGTAVEAVSGYLFGPWLGALYALVGIVIGSALNFFLARSFGRPLIGRLIGPRSLARLDDLARRGGTLFFFLLWLFPFLPDDLACLAAGLTTMPGGRFLLLVTVGRLPGLLISTWMGAYATHLSPGGWAIGLAIVGLTAVLLWRWGSSIQERVLRFIGWLSREPGR
jgi:uncharacterized membrane protein YdjX (TVP38/TMEM64 family)